MKYLAIISILDRSSHFWECQQQRVKLALKTEQKLDITFHRFIKENSANFFIEHLMMKMFIFTMNILVTLTIVSIVEASKSTKNI